jgi:hypothetical protein
MRKTLWITAMWIVLLGASAKADNFYFSFTNTSGNVNGTVTGEILGLTNNGIPGPASQVIILTYPSGLSPYESAPLDATAWPAQSANDFTETAGAIVSANFIASDAAGTCAILSGGQCFFRLAKPPVFNVEALLYGGPVNTQRTVESAVPSEITFTATVPEPSSAILMSTALLTVAFVGRKRIAHGR